MMGGFQHNRASRTDVFTGQCKAVRRAGCLDHDIESPGRNVRVPTDVDAALSKNLQFFLVPSQDGDVAVGAVQELCAQQSQFSVTNDQYAVLCSDGYLFENLTRRRKRLRKDGLVIRDFIRKRIQILRRKTEKIGKSSIASVNA